MSDDISLLEKIAKAAGDAAWIIPELFLYAPFDLLTAPIRDRVIPYSWKKKVPALACRGTRMWNSSSSPTCKPGKKYRHKMIMKCLCWNYDPETEKCMKYKKKADTETK